MVLFAIKHTKQHRPAQAPASRAAPSSPKPASKELPTEKSLFFFLSGRAARLACLVHDFRPRVFWRPLVTFIFLIFFAPYTTNSFVRSFASSINITGSSLVRSHNRACNFTKGEKNRLCLYEVKASSDVSYNKDGTVASIAFVEVQSSNDVPRTDPT